MVGYSRTKSLTLLGGVLAAAALQCLGGKMVGRLVFRNEDEKARAAKWGIQDLNRIYKLEDLAKGDCIFAATGVTDGSLLGGVKRRRKPTGQTITAAARSESGSPKTSRGCTMVLLRIPTLTTRIASTSWAPLSDTEMNCSCLRSA